MRNRWHIAVGGVLVGGSLLTACGDDGGGRTRAAFVAEANELCAGLIEARTTLAEKHFPSETTLPTVEQLQGFYADFGPSFADFVDELADVEPAEADRGLYDELMDQGRQIAATLETAATDTATAEHLLDTDEAEFHEADAVIVQLGLNPEC